MKNMNPEAYLNVSVDHLFEQHTIADVEQVNKKLLNEIEQKRIEIRRFVGERYRDLIQAADSIGEMKENSASLIGHVDKIANSSKKLNDLQLIGFRNEIPSSIRQERQQRMKFFGVVLQIKILSKIPDKIVKFLEVEDFFRASQLYILSRHIRTGLEAGEVRGKFPVLDTLWDSLNPFFENIKNRCSQTLERESLCAEVAAKCLASILLLENCDFAKLVSILVEARSKSFTDTLEEHAYETAREKILASLRVLNETIELLDACFIKGLLFSQLGSVSNDDAPTTLSYVFDVNDPKLKFLPEIVSKFKPHVKIAPVETSYLQASLEKWMEFIKEISVTKVGSVVLFITSIKTIQEVKRQTAKISKPKTAMFQALGLSTSLDFYVVFYQRLVDLRLQQIIENAWNLAINETFDGIRKVLEERRKSKESMKQWLWKEEIKDNPQSLKFALEVSSDKRKLLMKANGFTPDIVSLCMELDKKLEALFSDVKAYLDRETDASFRLKTDEMPDQIGTFLNNCSSESINRLITEIKSLQLDNSQDIMIIARLFQAIPQLCIHLRCCLVSSTLTFQDSSVDKSIYTRTAQLLNEESINFWMKWLESFWSAIETKFKCSTTNFNIILKQFPSWEVVEIQEKDEQDNSVNSTIRVPSKPSFPLQRFLHEICTALNEIVPHTLPKSISIALVERISHYLQNYYKNLSDNNFVKGNQNAALQYYLDVKFVNHLLVPKDNKILLESYQKLSLEYKNLIDPFDFDVFFPYVNENVKKSAQRTQYQIGCLSSTVDQNLLSSSQKQEKDPNVLTLSSNATTITWFPLLPISDPTSEVSMNTGVLTSSVSIGKLSAIADSEKTLNTSRSATSLDKTLRTAQNYADNMKSGAAALFGDWFKS